MVVSFVESQYEESNNMYSGLLTWNPFIIPRSQHNVRIERFWRDLRKDVLEPWRLFFTRMEKEGLLNKDDPVQTMALFLVFAPRIQAAVDRAVDAWNAHQMSSEHGQEPRAMFELGRLEARRLGYWENDCPEDLERMVAEAWEETEANIIQANGGRRPSALDEYHAGLRIHDDQKLNKARELLDHIDFKRDDGEWGTDVYLEAVSALSIAVEELRRDAESSDED